MLGELLDEFHAARLVAPLVVVVVGLVQGDHNVAGDGLQEVLQLLVAEGFAGRVVGIAEHYEPPIGLVGGFRHGVQVVGSIRQEWYLHNAGSGDASHDGVGLETAPRHNHIFGGYLVVPGFCVAGAGGLDEVLQEGHRTVAYHHIGGGDVAVRAGVALLQVAVDDVGDGRSQVRRAGVGVAVGVGDFFRNGVHHALARGVHYFVAGKLAGSRDGAARHIGGNLVEVGAERWGSSFVHTLHRKASSCSLEVQV